MVSSKILATVAAVSALTPFAAAFDPSASTNLAIYYVSLQLSLVYFLILNRAKARTKNG